MKKLLLIPTTLLLANCAMTYKAPIGESKSAKSTITKNLFSKANRTIILDGYKTTYSNKEDGLISTDYKVVDIKPSEADCGKTMGLDYLKDNRTKTEIAFTIVVDNNSIEVKSNIRAEYKPSGATAQGIDLTCISKGVLEQKLLNKIVK